MYKIKCVSIAYKGFWKGKEMQTFYEFVAWLKIFFQANVINTVKTITVKDVIDILLLSVIL